MTATQLTGLETLNALKVPVKNGQIDWDALSVEDLHQVVRGAVEHLDAQEPSEPTDGVLERSVQLEETARAIVPLQHRYAGLLEDAYSTPKLRATVGLSQGKTPFRDASDFIAKTHGLRAFESTGRLKVSRHLTPARASDPSRNKEVDVGATRYPLLGALQAQGSLHPSKLSTAVNMLTELDDQATVAGKDKDFRKRLQKVVEKDLVEKIEHTTPEEFSRFASRRKADLIAGMDPPDQKFTTAHTESMHNLRSIGPVRGNAGANKWDLVADAELNELLNTLTSIVNNPRAASNETESTDGEDNSSKDEVADRRTRGQRAMHALRDALKFAIAHLERTDLPGTNGNHTQLVVLTDYPTLMQHLRDELQHLLPEVEASRREYLLQVLAQTKLEADLAPSTDDGNSAADLHVQTVQDKTGTVDAPEKEAPVDTQHDLSAIEAEEATVKQFPAPKTTNLNEILGDENLDRLQPRISQGLYTTYYPPEIVLRLLCDVSVSPITLTGDRQVLSIGRRQRQFPAHIRRAILARDRGCTVPGCHWPAAWCEMHHIDFWSRNGDTSTDNGITMCAHHHQALHAKTLSIERVDGTMQFIQHPLIDPSQQPRQNYFWQN